MELINNTSFRFANIVGRINFPHHSLTLIVKATFDLKPDQPAQPADDQLFPTGDEFAPQDPEQTGSIQYESDFAYFKPCADLLLVGNCHAPNGQAVTHCDVSFQVGEKRRVLRAFGNRYWEHTIGAGSISEPTGFVDMPINYENAFGGEGYRKNPIGRGIVKGKLLPNIEDPSRLITSAGDNPDPAGFGPLHRLWEQRYSKLGTYKDDYLKKHWPWFPQDFDWSHYNAALPEMRYDGYLKGDEMLIFENLHSSHAKFESRLPGLRIRCFKRYLPSATDKHVFEEVAMNLDTLWVNMEEEKLVLVWRGWTAVDSDEFEEIEHIFITSESLEQEPASVDQAHDLFKHKREELEKQWALAPEAPEAPEPIIADTAPEEKATALEVSSAPLDSKSIQLQVNKLLAQFGIDVENLPPATQKNIIEQQENLLQRLTETDPEKLAEMERQELQAQLKGELAKLDIDLDNPPPVSEKARHEQLRFMQALGFDKEAQLGAEELQPFWAVVSAIFPKIGIDPEDLTPLLEHAKKQKETLDKQAAVEPENATKPDAELAAEKLKQFKSRVDNGDSFAGEDCSGMDLSGLNLKGLDFSGALFIGTNLQNSDLSEATLHQAKLINANLTNAKLNRVKMLAADCTNADLSCAQCVASNLSASVFANAKIIGADFSECDLSLTNLSGSDLSGSKFENANMALTNASKAQLNNANLFGADLADALLEDAQITNARLDQITAKDAIFCGANLSNSRFVEAKLPGADFSAAVVSDANFQGADLSEASLEKVIARRINLSHAILEKLRASEASDFSSANLERAQGRESIWHHAILTGADFSFVKMEAADFTKASLQNANCYGADMRFARFRKADLTAAQMLDMNLFKGSLEKANLTNTVFNGSNLYGVEFLEAHLEKTQLGGANLKATKLQEAV